MAGASRTCSHTGHGVALGKGPLLDRPVRQGGTSLSCGRCERPLSTPPSWSYQSPARGRHTPTDLRVLLPAHHDCFSKRAPQNPFQAGLACGSSEKDRLSPLGGGAPRSPSEKPLLPHGRPLSLDQKVPQSHPLLSGSRGPPDRVPGPPAHLCWMQLPRSDPWVGQQSGPSRPSGDEGVLPV